LSYAEFFKFITDFDLALALALSSMEIGEIFLAAIDDQELETEASLAGGRVVRHLDHDEFQKALLLLAVAAYEKKMATYDMVQGTSRDALRDVRSGGGVANVDKIRSLFLQMYRAVLHFQDLSKARVKLRNVTTYDMDLRQGASKFLALFGKQWQADGFRDYLVPTASEVEDKAKELERMFESAHIDASAKTTPAASHRRAEDERIDDNRTPGDASTKSVLDPESVETIRGYLDTRPELKGLLTHQLEDEGDERRYDDEEDVSDANGRDNADSGVSLDEYERAMKALRNQIELDGDIYGVDVGNGL